MTHRRSLHSDRRSRALVNRKETNMKVATNQWRTSRIDFTDNDFTVTFDTTKAIEWRENTFEDASKVGVWNKADSLTLF